MEYITSLIWFAAWPILIIASYQLVKKLTLKGETK